MFANIQQFWRRQHQKDQLYLIIGAIAAIIFLLWTLVCQPLLEWRDQERRRLANLTQTLNTVALLAGQIERREQQYSKRHATNNASLQNPPGNDNLAGIIDVSLGDHSLRMKGLQPGGNGEVRLGLENATYKPLIQWLYDLEYRHNIQIVELNLAQTEAVGLLRVSLKLKRAVASR